MLCARKIKEPTGTTTNQKFIPKNGHLRPPDIVEGGEENHQWLFDILPEECLPFYFQMPSDDLECWVMTDILVWPHPKDNNRTDSSPENMLAMVYRNFLK